MTANLQINLKMTKPVKVNVNKQEVTNYLMKKKMKLTVNLNKTDTINLVMKKWSVKLVKVSPSPTISLTRSILCCTTCFFFLSGGGSVWAMGLGHLLCGGCLQGMRCCRVCGGRGAQGVFLQWGGTMICKQYFILHISSINESTY